MSGAELAARLEAKRAGHGWQAKCPAHEDNTPSLSISDGRDGRALVHCHAGCSFEAITAALRVEARELFVDAGQPTKREVATYVYRDEQGNALFEVVRFEPKGFAQRRPNGEWGLNGTRRVLYHLPELKAAIAAGKRVFIVEGEKDVHAVERAGYTATCNPQGAGKWRPEYSEMLRGANAVIVADKDTPGRAHAQQIATALQNIATKIVVVEPVAGKDVSDHLAAGKTLAELVAPETTTSTIDADGFIRVGDLVAKPDNPHPWVVDGLIPSGGMGLAAGKPKAGKSTLARAIALRVCRGDPVLGRATMQGPVLYLGLEDPEDAIKGHFRRMGAGPSDDLHVYMGKVPEHAQAWLADQLAKRDPVLVVIDTMQFFLGIAEINEYSQVVNALRSILELFRGRRTAVLIVHHAGKGDRVGFDAILGSTGILGTVDTAMLVKRRPDDQTRTIATMQRMHAPGGEDMPETVLELDDHTEPRLSGTRAEYDLEKMGQAIIAYLTPQTDWLERSAVLEGVEGATKLKVDALDRLFRSGAVERQGEGRRGKPYLFRLPRTESTDAENPFFRSGTTVRTAERKPETVGSARSDKANSVLPFSGLGETGPEPRTESRAHTCPKGHPMTHLAGTPPDAGWVCGTCYPTTLPDANESAVAVTGASA